MERFLDLACLTYTEADSPERWAEAGSLADPGTGLAVAAARGEVDDVRTLLAGGADANAVLGPRSWPPLLYLTYSRVPQADAAGSLQALLDAGADPRFVWGEWDTPFTALTGCFGEGEMGPGRQPRHPEVEPLATALIAAGSDPNDAQTLYNRMFGRDDAHLRLLLAHGLDDVDPLAQQVAWAAEHGYTDRLALLAEHGFILAQAPGHWPRADDQPPIARVGTPAAVHAFAGDVDALVEGRTALHRFAWLGDVEMVHALLDAGADPTVVDDTYGTTPLGWAEWAFAAETAEILRAVV